MPIYEFECRKCKAHSEVLQKLNDKPPVKCSKCGGRLERVASAPAIQFKGTGWYVTDYAGKNGKKEKAAEEKSDTSDTTSSAKSDTKETSPAKKSSETTSATKKPSD
ncbi:MAG: type antifreeze protein [Acidobacteria bacterium]|jgi:putative FmdB family regulatory protein|nr:type antifreeze protein [Acidobacteriota bacterium]